MSKDKSLLRKFMPGTPKTPEKKDPRSKEAINAEYTQLATQLGAKTVEAESVKRQTAYLIQKIDELGAEMNARVIIDTNAAAAEAKNAEVRKENGTEAPANTNQA